MIYCGRSELSRYLGISAELDAALRFAMGLDEGKLVPGRNEVPGSEGVYANCFTYTTLPADGLLFESHLRNADLHLALSGEEMIQLARQENLKEVEARREEDYIGLSGPHEALVRLGPADALLVFPGEAHKVKCVWEAPGEVRKLVVKIPAGAAPPVSGA